MLFRIDTDLLQLGKEAVHRGAPIMVLRERLGLRKGRANTLTNRIHLVFCALAAARVYRGDGYLAVDEIGTREVRAELGEVLTGTGSGRRSADELTLFKSLGLAIEDLAAVEHLYGRAIETGAGQRVEL